MKYLFFLGHDGFIRNFEPVLESLAERGHAVHLALADRRPALMSAARSVEELAAAYPAITWSTAPRAGGPRVVAAEAVVRTRNYLRYLDPAFADAPKLRARAAAHTPAPLRAAADRAPASVRRVADRVLAAALRRIPPDAGITAYIANHAPDAVLLTPLVGFSLGQHAALRAARELGVPTALLVHSWDNLTNKGLIQEAPDRVVVWNDDQAREARELHAVPPRRIEVTGAQAWDEWFERRPVSSREELCDKVGLDPARPFVLYVGSSSFIAPDEPAFVERWLAALRAAPDERLRELGVLLRPHPQNEEPWRGIDLAEPGRTAVWPRPGAARSGPGARADFFDSVFHAAAVVGINTSALIESAIVGRPVLTFLDDAFRDTQSGTLHFRYLTGDDGFLDVATTMQEHHAQLLDVLADGESAAARAARFVRRFVRPQGMDVPSTPRVVAALEALAEAPRPRTERECRAAGVAARAPLPEGRRRFLFFMRAINYDRLFEGMLREVLSRGHQVHVLLDVHKRGPAGDSALFDALRAEFPAFDYAPAPQRPGGAWARFGDALRYGIDYLRYLEPAFRDAPALRERARARAPRAVVALTTAAAASPRLRRTLSTALRAVERAVPTPRAVEAFVRSFRPDVVLVSPLVGLGSAQGEYLRVARLAGVPTAFVVASWDNLTNKGIVRDVADLTVVWNDAQRREAVQLHGIPDETILVAGAHSFDHWFDRKPSRGRNRFCEELGLDPERPYILYVGSSMFIALDEAAFVRRWLESLESSRRPELRGVNVVVRPHPANLASWEKLDPSVPGRVVVYPRAIVRPTTEERKAAYFDSIYHSAAVVGINTSALVESAILGRPVLTIVTPEFRDRQEGTLHFAYLTGRNGTGLLHVAHDLDTHESQLADAISHGDGSRADDFVRDFLRPRGRGVAASPLVADALEELAAQPVPSPAAPPAGLVVLRACLAPFVHAGAALVPWLRRLARGRRS